MSFRSLILIFAGLCVGYSWSDDPSEYPITEITHEKPANGLWSLDFDAEDYRQLERSKQRIIAKGQHDSNIVGFQITYEPNFKYFKDTANEPRGYISIESIGEESDSFVRALHKIFGEEEGKPRFKALLKCPARSLKGQAWDFRTGQIDFLIESKTTGNTGYFEFQLSIFKDERTVWIKEIKQAYRKSILAALSK